MISRNIRALCVLRVVIALGALWSASAVTLAAAEPAQVLSDRGLVKSGNLYLVTEEAALRTRLTDLKKLEKTFADTQKKMKEALAANANMISQMDKAKKEIEQIQQRLQVTTNPAQANQLQQLRTQREDLIKGLRGKVFDAQSRSECVPLRTAIVEFGNSQAILGLALQSILEARSQLGPAYEKLQDDEQLKTALESLNSKLGPARAYETDFKRLDKLLSQVFSNDVPVYMSDFRYRLIAVVAEKAPISISYTVENEFNTLAASAVEAAGLTIPANAPQGTLMAGERKIAFRQIKISTLRLGKHVFRDVPALALSPEGEDLGSMLGSKFFEECKVNFLQQELKFELQPNLSEKSPESK